MRPITKLKSFFSWGLEIEIKKIKQCGNNVAANDCSSLEGKALECIIFLHLLDVLFTFISEPWTLINIFTVISNLRLPGRYH